MGLPQMRTLQQEVLALAQQEGGHLRDVTISWPVPLGVPGAAGALRLALFGYLAAPRPTDPAQHGIWAPLFHGVIVVDPAQGTWRLDSAFQVVKKTPRLVGVWPPEDVAAAWLPMLAALPAALAGLYPDLLADWLAGRPPTAGQSFITTATALWPAGLWPHYAALNPAFFTWLGWDPAAAVAPEEA